MTREQLLARVVGVLRDESPISPVIRLVRVNGKTCIWKDFSDRGFFVKAFVGLLIITREWMFISRLGTASCVPRAVQKVGWLGFIQEYVEAKPIHKLSPQEISPVLFERILEAIGELHRRGVVHLDLRERKNILIAPDGKPYLIDFATAFYFPPGMPFAQELLDAIRLVDVSAVLKFKNRMCPGTLTEREKSFMRTFAALRRRWPFRRWKERSKDVIR
jgi:RIO-like serine/threonine protein kinase